MYPGTATSGMPLPRAPRTVYGVNETSRRPNLIDVPIAVGTALALVLLTQIAREEGAAPLDFGAYLLAGLVGLVLLWRDRKSVV